MGVFFLWIYVPFSKEKPYKDYGRPTANSRGK